MASKGAAGSQVIICTDGLSNVGLGSFEGCVTDDDYEKAEAFYVEAGEYARKNGISVSIASIEGEECNINSLCKIADLTGGDVQRVKPTEVTDNFASLLSLPVLATNVELKVKLHQGLEFRNEDPSALSQDNTILSKSFGNVNEETEITFEYRMKKVADLLKYKDIDMSKLTHLPFQAQIAYTSLQGNRCVRVISQRE